jgi:MFS transporter, DHA1 family, multidrug resistance protein
LFDPISFLVAIYLSVVYTLLYMLFTIYPIVFQQRRGWNAGVGELPLIGTVVGANIGGAIVFYVSSRDRKRMLAGHQMTPEDRLTLPMFAGFLFPLTMFWFAWSAEYNSVHWIVPTLAGTVLSTSIMLIFVGYLNYLTDTYLMYTASAMAANTICRSACGAASPLFTEQMFSALGVGGGGSLIGGVACLLAPIPFVFYRYGRKIREKSKFAPTGPPPDQKSDNKEKQQSQSEEPSPESAEGDSGTRSDGEESLEYGADYPPNAEKDESRPRKESSAA